MTDYHSKEKIMITTMATLLNHIPMFQTSL